MTATTEARKTTPGPAARTRITRRRMALKRAGLALRYGVLIATVVLALFPLAWLIVTSLRTSADISAVPVQLLPKTVTLSQYAKAFGDYDVASYLRNSLVVSIVTVVFVTVLAVPAAYALSRLRLPGGKVIVTILLMMQIIPVIAFTIPLFVVFSRIGLLDSLTGLILVHTASKLPLAIWLLMVFIRDLPKEIEESAEIDGAGVLRKLITVVTPLIRPGLMASGVLVFLFTWNDLLTALTLTSSTASQTLPVGLTNFVSQFGIDWGGMSAAGVLMIIPALVFVWFAEGHLVKGLVAGAVRG
jgi:multiple sugar transport system permease protein